jgi:acetolactate synthase-1/2/3 large subunit
MWSAQFLTINEPRRFITSGGLGTMGFGLPAAIGAQVGQPDALVVDIDGDGSFQMVLQDLGTIARYGLPVKVIITNNRYLGMVRQWQELFYGRRYFAVDLEKGTPDFVKLADAYGIAADVVESPSELGEKIETMINHDGPFILDARVHEEENVFPMVPAGASLDEIIGGD